MVVPAALLRRAALFIAILFGTQLCGASRPPGPSSSGGSGNENQRSRQLAVGLDISEEENHSSKSLWAEVRSSGAQGLAHNPSWKHRLHQTSLLATTWRARGYEEGLRQDILAERGSQLELLEVAGAVVPKRIGLRTLIAFYVLVYGIVLSIYFVFFRLRDPERGGCAPLMRGVAQLYARHRAVPVVANMILYIISDLFARFIEIPRGFDPRWTFCVGLMSPLFNGYSLVKLYERADARLGDKRELSNIVKRVALMQVLHLAFYIPLSCFLFPFLTGWLFRIIIDAAQTCGTAAILNIPTNMALAFTASCASFWDAIVNSWLLYIPSNILNFTFIHRWCPEFRSTWDTSICLLWDIFDLAFHVVTGFESGMGAVGHILVAISPAGVVAVKPPLDCARHSFWALFVTFWVTFFSVLYWLLYQFITKTWWLLRWLGIHLWRFTVFVCTWLVKISYFLWSLVRTIVSIIYDIFFVLPGAVWNVVNGKPMLDGVDLSEDQNVSSTTSQAASSASMNESANSSDASTLPSTTGQASSTLEPGAGG